MLCISRKPGTTLVIDDSNGNGLVTIHFRANGSIAIDAPAHIRIRRGELPADAVLLAPVQPHGGSDIDVGTNVQTAARG